MPVWFWFHIAMEDGSGIDAALVLRMLRVLLCRIVERRDRSAAHPRHRNTQARPWQRTPIKLTDGGGR